MNTLQARLHAIEWLANDIQAFELRPMDSAHWPAASAGAHVDLHLPNGQVRSYSLINGPLDTSGYRIAVHRSPISRGGSICLHEQVRVGQRITLSEPRNHFPLRDGASHSVLIAGGIGVTPIYSMALQLTHTGAPWTLHYAARNRESAAFVDALEALAASSGNALHLHFDEGLSERRVDLRALIDAAPAQADVYCCGPGPMLQSFEAATAQLDPARVHREYFAAPASTTAPQATTGFTIHLAKSGRSLSVNEGVSILDTVLQAGIEVPYSCVSGICGACTTGVLAGVPDHQDLVLTDAERAAGDRMVICCSRACTPELTLDL